MSTYEKLVEIVTSPDVTTGVELPRAKLHKWLVLGQTDYLCENGTLSDGHEKFTPAQKYAQALKELYYVSLNVQQMEASAMEAQADILDAEDAVKVAQTPAQTLRANARLKSATIRLTTSLTNVEDQMRMVRFYHRKVKELGPSVEAAYPGGIETAEVDNWEAVAVYRLEKEQTPGLARERLDHLPLPLDRKAMLGHIRGRPDAIAGLKVTDPERCQAMHEAVVRLVESKTQEQKEAN